MNPVKEHYDNHLASFYSWMAGDFTSKQNEFTQFLQNNTITPVSSGIALDLGCGHGIQSYALAKLGFKVTALDFSHNLLKELNNNCAGLTVTAIEDDIRNVEKYRDLEPEVIVCWGDTLTHFENYNQVEKFLEDCYDILPMNGKLILSFRDYSVKLNGDERFIPVKNDDQKILTCFLEYLPTQVRVTDLLYEKNEGKWRQKISSYFKFRISDSEVEDLLVTNGMSLIFSGQVNGMITFIATK